MLSIRLFALFPHRINNCNSLLGACVWGCKLEMVKTKR